MDIPDRDAMDTSQMLLHILDRTKSLHILFNGIVRKWATAGWMEGDRIVTANGLNDDHGSREKKPKKTAYTVKG
jgi:hypothetical protein